MKFLFSVPGEGLMHPQEATALFSGFIYYITIPSMYMLLMIYSVFNMNDVSWGTREKRPVENQSSSAKEVITSMFFVYNKLFLFSGEDYECKVIQTR